MAGDWQTDGPDLPRRVRPDLFGRWTDAGHRPRLSAPFHDRLGHQRPRRTRRRPRRPGTSETDATIETIHGVGPDGLLGTDPLPPLPHRVSDWRDDNPTWMPRVWTGLGPGALWGDEGWGMEQAAATSVSLDGPTRARALEYIGAPHARSTRRYAGRSRPGASRAGRSPSIRMPPGREATIPRPAAATTAGMPPDRTNCR